MNLTCTASVASLTLLALSIPLFACEEYDPPPTAKIVQPKGGFWTSETPLELTFSEAIDPASLVFDIRPAKYDIEGNYAPSVAPVLEGCTPLGPTCGALGVALDGAQTRLTLTQNDAFADYIGEPLVIVIRGGLKDRAGRPRVVDTKFDFQINPPGCDGSPVDLSLPMSQGVFSLAANLDPIGLNGIYLRMVLDVGVDQEDGLAKVVGTYARLKIGGETWPQNYALPDGYEAVLDDTSWVVSFDACFSKLDEGQYFMQSQPFDVSIKLLNVIPITLTDFRVQGTLRPSTEAGVRSTFSGTLSTSGGQFGEPPTAVNAITTAWDGASFFKEEIDANLPQVCKEDPCAPIDAAGGDCQLASPWENERFCE